METSPLAHIFNDEDFSGSRPLNPIFFEKLQEIVIKIYPRGIGVLNEAMKRERRSSVSGLVNESLSILLGLHSQAKEGFTEVRVRNPMTGEERIMR